jgi:undecaprenyl-diphosphatase
MKRLLTSCFGLGWLPIAPGSWGSLPPVFIFALMCYFNAPSALTAIVMAVIVLICSVVCVKFAPFSIAATGKTDPGEVVVDETAGQAITFLIAGAVSAEMIFAAAVSGFLIFRFFDIVKPWLVRRLEKLPQGWGILADDLLAGVYAGIVLLLCYKTGVVKYLSGLLPCGNNATLNILQAAVLGAVQGLTEFLPVSSSGHLVLFENFFHLNAEKPEMLLFDLAVHVGTVLAIFVVFHKPIIAFIKNLFDYKKYGSSFSEIYRKSPSVHILILAVAATFVTGVLGVLFKDYFTASFGSLKILAVLWFVNGIVLQITDFRKKTKLGLRQFGIVAAMAVGVAQAVAILPSISRSGATICAAILLGLRRRWAVEFCFLLAIPAILGATAVELIGEFDKIKAAGLSLDSVLTGLFISAIVGIPALKVLIKTVRTAKLKFFAFYCYAIAIFTMLYTLRQG